MLAPLAPEQIAVHLGMQVARAGLERDILEPTAVDLLAEGRTLMDEEIGQRRSAREPDDP